MILASVVHLRHFGTCASAEGKNIEFNRFVLCLKTFSTSNKRHKLTSYIFITFWNQEIEYGDVARAFVDKH